MCIWHPPPKKKDGTANGSWALHKAIDSSIDGNSGTPRTGSQGGMGFHYGKTPTPGRTAVLCPSGDHAVTIQLAVKGPKNAMMAEQVRAVARP